MIIFATLVVLIITANRKK
nr:hypothetical protein [Pueribacillus theae]